MGLRDRARRLAREVEKGLVVLNLRDGTRRTFEEMEVWKEMFLCRMELFRDKARPSEVLDAVRAATPESRKAFEEEYGTIEMVNHVIAPAHKGGWVDEYRLLEDGTFDRTRHEGGSEEAERIRQEARRPGPAS